MKKTEIRKSMAFAAFICAATAAVIRNSAFTDGARRGIGICLDTIVPSLFPMMILSSFLSFTGLPFFFRRICALPLKIVPGLPESSAEAFILGALGGYPVGVKTTALLLNNKKIIMKEAKKAALINVNPGIAFSVLVIGKQLFGSLLLGFTLYGSVTLANVFLCFALRKNDVRRNSGLTHETDSKNIPDALIAAVAGAVKSTVGVCAWIVAFSAFYALIPDIPGKTALSLFAEVTAAVQLCAAKRAAPLCAFCMGFGGICLFFQLLPELRQMKIQPWKYFSARLFAGLSAYITESIIIKLFPSCIMAFRYENAVISPYKGSALGGVSLIVLCAVFMLSLYSDKYTTCENL